MKLSQHHPVRSATLALAALILIRTVPMASAAAADYRIELAGKPQLASGKSVVPVRIVHLPDNQPVTDAVVFEMKADMGPSGMPTMTAPIKLLSGGQPGTYHLEVDPAMTGTWAITLGAKIQGERDTVRGTVNADLVK